MRMVNWTVFGMRSGIARGRELVHQSEGRLRGIEPQTQPFEVKITFAERLQKLSYLFARSKIVLRLEI